MCDLLWSDPDGTYTILPASLDFAPQVCEWIGGSLVRQGADDPSHFRYKRLGPFSTRSRLPVWGGHHEDLRT